ncbi:hypothetical protein [Streptomyces brasiliensis]|uniref:DUF4190 domain-containing protein n=1 Tax=Streptomyces brasiliensis TaxID=1954 RepID=A0A917KLF4_9ACTN|nr:hypothetical protein [Streptomyces brasiliensis]GGJ16241.1 hypothetical protein GCM10010121_028680 [Streptomyces brasiliensis]
MTSEGGLEEGLGDIPRGKELAVWFGGASVGVWLCCPFWTLTCFVALPLGLIGLVCARIEYLEALDGRAHRRRAVTGGVLSLVGTAAAIVYLVFLVSHPDLPAQG